MLRFGGIERCLWLHAMLMLSMMLAAGGTFLQSGGYVAFRIVCELESRMQAPFAPRTARSHTWNALFGEVGTEVEPHGIGSNQIRKSASSSSCHQPRHQPRQIRKSASSSSCSRALLNS